MVLKKVIWVKCPQCGRSVKWSKRNFYRPFCGRICKIIDFGEWIGEESSNTQDN
ncbi:DNA gyrase inhibitor YacG [Candidatus Photodesmus blepharus]|uniref:DNA gyrase inhibitor YacG n=1 Tax=Candidatus Photodesmus blepharonis TaxID=1179155 RepID=UPI003B969EC7